MALYLGMDGGGTKTECAVGDDSAILGRSKTGGSKVQRVGEECARESLHQAIVQACQQARRDPAAITHACVGIAGASNPQARDTVRRIVAEVVPASIDVVGDMVVGFEAAFPEASGLLVLAGTGSIAFGRNERGETARAGGWGSAISDEGSGDWIGRAGVAAALRAFDSGQSNALIGGIMNAWHVATREDVARVANSIPPPDFAALFPLVLSAADRGDGLARDILMRAGTELATLAKVAMRRLWPGPHPIRVRISGGVFMNSFCVQQVFENSARAERPQCSVSFGQADGAAGALVCARRSAKAHAKDAVAAPHSAS
ncbi:MAG: hypothetical protein L0099_01425 [Acidobacteria bacterium]|nr:hypothetical protein [Acidobacteriota bacterium]